MNGWYPPRIRFFGPGRSCHPLIVTQASDDNQIDIRWQILRFKAEEERGDLSTTVFVSHPSCSDITLLKYCLYLFVELRNNLPLSYLLCPWSRLCFFAVVSRTWHPTHLVSSLSRVEYRVAPLARWTGIVTWWNATAHIRERERDVIEPMWCGVGCQHIDKQSSTW